MAERRTAVDVIVFGADDNGAAGESTAGDGALLPNMIPSGKLDEFCQGFTDVILARVGQENAKAKAFRAQGKI